MITFTSPGLIRVENPPLSWSYLEIVAHEGQWVQVMRLEWVFDLKNGDMHGTAMVHPVDRLNRGANKLAIPPQ